MREYGFKDFNIWKNVMKCTVLFVWAVPCKIMCVILQFEEIMVVCHLRKPNNSFFIVFQESATVITWQQLHLLRLTAFCYF
jgi:hypothetical protein